MRSGGGATDGDDAAGGGGEGGLVGRVIEGVCRLRSAVSVINAGHSCGRQLIGHRCGRLSCLWVSCVSCVRVDSTFRTIPTLGILRSGSFSFPPKPIGVTLFNG